MRIILRHFLLTSLLLSPFARAESDRINETVCAMSNLVSEGKGAALFLERYEDKIPKSSLKKMDSITAAATEHILVGYAIGGHDNENKIRDVAQNLVKYCNENKSADVGACEQYRLAASEPSKFIDSIQPQRKWMAENQYQEHLARAQSHYRNARDKTGKSEANREDTELRKACAHRSPIAPLPSSNVSTVSFTGDSAIIDN